MEDTDLDGNLENSERSYYSQDHLGGTALVTDSTGIVTQLYDYYPYGSELLDSQPTGASVPAEHSFTDKELDDDLGLYYFEARWYDSDIGRFSSQDPAQWNQAENFLADPQQLNFYAYSRNNPIVLIDPSGEFAIAAIPAYYLYLAVAALLAGATVNATIQLQDIPTPTFFDDTPPQIETETTFITPIIEAIGGTTTLLPVEWNPGPYVTLPTEPLGTSDMSQGDITFGHGARHLEGTGLDQDAVENAIRNDVQNRLQESDDARWWGQVEVDGKNIEYRAHTREDTGELNVGTYYVKEGE